MKPRIYGSEDVAAICGCSESKAKHYAQDPGNDVRYLGKGRRGVYVWFDEDIERFKAHKPRVGRPPKTQD